MAWYHIMVVAILIQDFKLDEVEDATLSGSWDSEENLLEALLRRPTVPDTTKLWRQAIIPLLDFS